MEKNYDPGRVEPKWVDEWLRAGLFHSDAESSKPAFSIVIPPPNVTGSLHLGHALNNTLQDILCRFKRMTGHEVLWMPGTDHAGIATQNVVERQLAKQGIRKQDLSREDFVKRVWEWKKESGGQIVSQLKRLGCSCDWERERFTMDEGLSKVVREVFVRLYQEGFIYRGNYMINWCCRCESALSDLEVEYPDEPEEGFLYRLSYPIQNPDANGLQAVVVDTTRPETMLGDTAVAVHPDDPRYQNIIGKKVILPIVGRVIPVIADSFVDPQFGSGAVKVTPGHDPNDFEAGRRHGLEVVSVIGTQGKMTADAGQYAGLDRFVCREKILEELKALGVLQEIRKHQLKTGRCYRCQTVTEPLVSTQWFMCMKDLAANAAKAVQDKRTRIIPRSWEGTYFQWLENIRDWCISRQLWWGHQIPVWYCDCGEVICQMEPPGSCPKCKNEKLRQDSDVLDTWFSSALWPFSTMGWPAATPLMKKFYPTSVLVTGFDILFFWVARMMMMALKLTDTIPFHDIYLHAMVRDEHGQKMSKTKGNVIDPLVLIEKYGADALRFTLAILAVQGRDVNLSPARIEGYRNFINKIWNAVRFLLMQFGDETRDVTVTKPSDAGNGIYERWIRSRLARAIQANHEGYQRYDFSEVCTATYRFFWDEFCAWYVEISKLQLRDAAAEERQPILANLAIVLDSSLRLLHPVLPFVTDELWKEIPTINQQQRGLLLTTRFPVLDEWSGALAVDEQAEPEMNLVCGVVTAIRTLRAEKNIPPGALLRLVVEGDASETEIVFRHTAMLQGLARLTEVLRGAKPERASAMVVSKLQVFLVFEEALDIDAERKRVAKELGVIEQELARVKSKLERKEFLEKAPPDVIAKERRKLEGYEERKRVLVQAASELPK